MSNLMQLHAARRAAVGMGGEWWEPLVQGGFAFGNRFLQAYENRGVARSGVNPYYTGGEGGGSVLTTELERLRAAQLAAGIAPGSQISGGVSQAWAQMAATIGVQPGTLTMLALAGGALLFLTPPGRRR